MTPAALRAEAARAEASAAEVATIYPAAILACADAARRLAAIQEAWTIPGRMPPYHAYMQELVRRDWPTLAQAIEQSLSDPRE